MTTLVLTMLRTTCTLPGLPPPVLPLGGRRVDEPLQLHQRGHLHPRRVVLDPDRETAVLVCAIFVDTPCSLGLLDLLDQLPLLPGDLEVHLLITTLHTRVCGIPAAASESQHLRGLYLLTNEKPVRPPTSCIICLL